MLLLVAATGAAEAAPREAAVVPLRLVNLHPFHLLYGAPRSFGAGVVRLGAVEVIASLDAASQFSRGSAGIPREPEHDATYREDFPGWALPGAERILIDMETYRQALALRIGLRERWELLVEVAAVAYLGGAFDRYVADWHRAFGLIPGGRQHVPHNCMALYYTRDAGRGGVHVDLEGGTAALWAETSGALPGAPAGRPWVYAATLGALAAEAPRGLPRAGRDWLLFGRLGVTWRPLSRLDLTAQIDAHGSPYSASKLPQLAHAAVMFGVGGALRLGERFPLAPSPTEAPRSTGCAGRGWHAPLPATGSEPLA